VCPVFNHSYRSHRARETKITGKIDTRPPSHYSRAQLPVGVQIHIEPISFLLCVHKTGGLATWNGQPLMLLSLLPRLSRKGREKHRLRENEHVVLAAYNGRSGLRATKCIITPSENAWIIRKWLERLR
jgi:hypothetical protein